MKKYKIDNYIVTANSLHDAVSIVRQIKDAYDNGIILEKHETYKGPNGQFTVVKVKRDNGRIQYVVTSDKRDIDAGDKMPSGTIENDLASAIKTAKEYANARKRNSDAAHDSIKDADEYMIEGNIVDKDDPMMTYQAYQNIARKYHLTIKNYTGDMLDLYGSKNDLQRYERDMHMSYSSIEKAHDSVKDARRINYDDDIIEVTLNGKVVFRGYAEDWLDNNFDSNFKWTGSQYEASNAKGKWVVRVIDSSRDSVKDSTGSDIVSEVKRAYSGVEVSQIAENRSIKGENYRKTELTFDFKKIPDKFESANRMFSYIERKYSDEARVFKKSDKTYVVIIFENLKKDSFQKDSLTVRDVIQSLVTEETSAIASYNVALETLKDHIPAEAYEAIKAIRDDEQRHVENLYAVLNGNVTPKNLEN